LAVAVCQPEEVHLWLAHTSVLQQVCTLQASRDSSWPDPNTDRSSWLQQLGSLQGLLYNLHKQYVGRRHTSTDEQSRAWTMHHLLQMNLRVKSGTGLSGSDGHGPTLRRAVSSSSMVRWGAAVAWLAGGRCNGAGAVVIPLKLTSLFTALGSTCPRGASPRPKSGCTQNGRAEYKRLLVCSMHLQAGRKATAHLGINTWTPAGCI
jgi:hypothetical protein